MNVQPIHIPVAMLAMQDVKICAHDREQHYTYYSLAHKGWIVKNINTQYSTYVSKVYPNLIAALSTLERFSCLRADDFTVVGDL